MEHLTFDEEIDNTIDCIEYLMGRMSDFLVNGDEGTLDEDEMVNDDAKKSLEFLHKAKEIVRGACVLATYAGEDWRERQDAYHFGADGYDYLDQYIEGGMELCDKFGTEDFYNDYSKYFVEKIRPKTKKIFNTTQSDLVKYKYWRRIN